MFTLVEVLVCGVIDRIVWVMHICVVRVLHELTFIFKVHQVIHPTIHAVGKLTQVGEEVYVDLLIFVFQIIGKFRTLTKTLSETIFSAKGARSVWALVILRDLQNWQLW